MFCRNILFIFTLSLITTNTLADEIFIKLSTQSLELPLPVGENYILTAQIKGEAENVRLTTNPNTEEGISLARTDDDEYQINIASRNVMDLLNTAKEKQFYVLANNSDQEIFSSISVNYTIKKPNVYILTANATPLLLSDQAYFTHDISAIEIESALEAVIAIGKKNWLFKNNEESQDATASKLKLLIDEEMRQQWEAQGTLSLAIDQHSEPVIIKAKPKLILNDLPQLFTLEQRNTKAIAGTNNKLKISIGDISRGYVNVTVYGDHTDNQKNLTESTTMSRYDKLSFNYAGQDYQLVLSEIHNSITGNDYANFIFAPKTVSELQKTKALLAHLQLSKKILMVENKQYYRQEIGRYLEDIFSLKDKELSLDKLIALITETEKERGFTHIFKSNQQETLTRWLINTEKRLAL